jgi:hypothetical protein
MAYTIKKRESYRWTVEYVLAVKQGVSEVMAFDAEFKALGQKRTNELLSRARDLAIKDKEFADEILIELHDLEGEGGKVYRKADLEELGELFPGLFSAIGRAWSQSVLGGAAARKN